MYMQLLTCRADKGHEHTSCHQRTARIQYSPSSMVDGIRLAMCVTNEDRGGHSAPILLGFFGSRVSLYAKKPAPARLPGGGNSPEKGGARAAGGAPGTDE